MSWSAGGMRRLVFAGALVAQAAAASPLAVVAQGREHPIAAGADAIGIIARHIPASGLHLRIALDQVRTIDILSPAAVVLADVLPDDDHGGGADPFRTRVAEPPPEGTLKRGAKLEPGSSAPAPPVEAAARSRPTEGGLPPLFRFALMAAVGCALLGLIMLGCGTALREMRRRHHRRALG